MKNKLLLTITSFLLVGALVGCTTQKDSEDFKPDSGDGSENPSSESIPSSESEEITLEGLLDEIALRALEKRCITLIPDYFCVECLGPNIYFKKYLGDAAYIGQSLFFVNEQGFFFYERANDEAEFVMNKMEIELDPDIDIYAEKVCSIYDVVNDDFADLVTLNEEKENSFLLDIDVSDDNLKTYLAVLAGHNETWFDGVSEATVEINKDASELTFNITIFQNVTTFIVTEFGAHTNREIEEFVANVPVYVPPVVPSRFYSAIAKIEQDGSNGVGRVVASNGSVYEYLTNGIYYRVTPTSKQIIFNHDGYGYHYVDNGSGFEPNADPKAGGYNINSSFYTLEDLFDGNFADAVAFEKETKNNYIGTISKYSLGEWAPGLLLNLGGYNSLLTSYLSELSFSMSKDGSAINITVKLNQDDIEYTLEISSLGDCYDHDLDLLVADIIESMSD